MRDGSKGWDDIQSWSEKLDGYRGYIQFTPMVIWEFYKSHPQKDILTKIYESAKEFSIEGYMSGKLPVVTEGTWVVGAENQPNFFQFTKPSWDYRKDTQSADSLKFNSISLVRLDKAAHEIANMRGCSNIARVLGKTADENDLQAKASELTNILKNKHWDKKTGMFYAADPKTFALADSAPCYDSFVPFMWGTINEKEYFKAFDKFFDPKWFWDEFPIRTVSQTCPMYWSGNAIVGPCAASETNPMYGACMWNGPVWHYTNGLMAEALGNAATIDSRLRDGWLEFMKRWTDLHFQYGDRSVPCAREHHRSTDGARHMPTADYFHSAWIDPFIRYWIGVRIEDDLTTVIFDPFSKENFSIRNLPVLGKELSFVQRKNQTGERVKEVFNSKGALIQRLEGEMPLVLREGSK